MLLFTNLHIFQSLKLLSVLAAIRLDGDADRIADTLVITLLDPTKVAVKSSTSNDPLASSTWEKVFCVFLWINEMVWVMYINLAFSYKNYLLEIRFFGNRMTKMGYHLLITQMYQKLLLLKGFLKRET